MISIYELHPGSFIKSSTGTGIGVWTVGNYEGIEKEFTDTGWVYKVQPEDITPEILEKCGFKKHTHGTYIYYRLRHVRIGRLNEGWVKVDSDCAVDSVEFFSLHQLQNLFYSIISGAPFTPESKSKAMIVQFPGEHRKDAIINHFSLDIEEEEWFLDYIKRMGYSIDDDDEIIENLFKMWNDNAHPNYPKSKA